MVYVPTTVVTVAVLPVNVVAVPVPFVRLDLTVVEPA